MSDVGIEREGPVTRTRAPRVEAQTEHRRRRQPGTLNRMQQFKLDFIAPEVLDTKNWFYCWANDDGANIRLMTRQDDYDFVKTSDLGEDFDPLSTDSESDERVRVLVGNLKNGDPMFAYLLRKPRAFWEEDQEAIVRNREDMMAGRVYEGDPNYSDEAQDPTRYVPQNVVMGHAGERRRGRVPTTLR